MNTTARPLRFRCIGCDHRFVSDSLPTGPEGCAECGGLRFEELPTSPLEGDCLNCEGTGVVAAGERTPATWAAPAETVERSCDACRGTGRAALRCECGEYDAVKLVDGLPWCQVCLVEAARDSIQLEVISILYFLEWARVKGDADDRLIAVRMAGRHRESNPTIRNYYDELLNLCLADMLRAKQKAWLETNKGNADRLVELGSKSSRRPRSKETASTAKAPASSPRASARPQRGRPPPMLGVSPRKCTPPPAPAFAPSLPPLARRDPDSATWRAMQQTGIATVRPGVAP